MCVCVYKCVYFCYHCSVAQSCPTLCNPKDCRTPGLSVSHHLPKLAQVHAIASVITSSHFILWQPLLLLPSIIPSIRNFSNESVVCITWPKYWSFSVIILMSIQGWFPLTLTGLISFLSKGHSRVFSSTIVRRHQFFGAPLSLRSSSHNCRWHWEDHSLHYVDLCQQSKVSALCPVVSIYM